LSPSPTLHISPTQRIKLSGGSSDAGSGNSNQLLKLTNRYNKDTNIASIQTRNIGVKFYLTPTGSIVYKLNTGSGFSNVKTGGDGAVGVGAYTLRLGETYLPASGNYKAWIRVYKPGSVTDYIYELPA